MKKILTIFLFFILSSLVYSADTITLGIRYLSPDSAENRKLMTSVLTRAASAASRRYGDYIEVHRKNEISGSADYDLSVTAVLDGDTPLMSVRSGDLSLTLQGPVTETSYIYLSEVIFKLWALANPDKIASNDRTPLFLEEVPSRYITESAIPDFTGYSTASAAAVKKDGTLVLAMGPLCYETDSRFDILSSVGADQFSPTGSQFLFGAAVTPGGSVFLKPANGREIYKAVEGAPRTIKIRTGIDVNGPMAVLPDGVVILYNTSGKKFVRIDGTSHSDLDLGLSQYAYVYSMATGPDGNLWLFDNVEQRFMVFSENGTYINSVIPVGLGSDTLFPMSMVVGRDGSILAYSGSALFKFSKEGILLWKMTGYRFRGDESFPRTPVNLALDEDNGLIYLTDYASNRVLQFYDPAYDQGEKNTAALEVLDLNRNISTAPDSIDPVKKKAEYYVQNNAWVLGRIWLEEVVDRDPYDREALDQLDGIKVRSLLATAAGLEKETLDTARQIGPESARNQFSRTVSLYEKILSIKPDDKEAKTRLSRFRDAYNREAAGVSPGEKPLAITALSLDGIFPSLMTWYRTHKIGTVTVKNDLDKPVEEVKASLDLGRFTDLPLQSENPVNLAPGEEAELDLKVLLNDQALNLSEDLPLPVQVKISYKLGGVSRTITKTKTATMYRRTALTWDNTAKLAAFIMPNETIVSTFSHRVLNGLKRLPGIPPQMNKAARICDALAVYGITYVEDPHTPLSRIMGENRSVDTVRYPRTTLSIRSGDCDDTTALLASLLESSGVSTAIMTSPGHVFMAFDTEEPEANRWIFEDGDRKIILNSGTIWIPVETTVLQKGFNEAWSSASQVMAKNGDKNIGFLPVKDVRDMFPPLPLGDSNLLVVEPGPREIDGMNGQTVTSLKTALYEKNIEKYEKAAAKGTDMEKRRNGNRLAVLHARFGEYDKAASQLKKLIASDPSYLSPYINLGNIYYLKGDYKAALDILSRGEKLKSDSALLNLALARTWYKLGDRSSADRYFRLVKKQSGKLAGRYAYLEENSNALRAGTDEEPPLSWPGD